MANQEPGLESNGDRFSIKAQEFIEITPELLELPLSEQDRISDIVAMTLEDMDCRLINEPEGSAYYLGVELTILGNKERLIRVRGQKFPQGVESDLDWFSDKEEIAHIKQYQQ